MRSDWSGSCTCTTCCARGRRDDRGTGARGTGARRRTARTRADRRTGAPAHRRSPRPSSRPLAPDRAPVRLCPRAPACPRRLRRRAKRGRRRPGRGRRGHRRPADDRPHAVHHGERRPQGVPRGRHRVPVRERRARGPQEGAGDLLRAGRGHVVGGDAGSSGSTTGARGRWRRARTWSSCSRTAAALTTSVLRYDQAKNEVSTDQHYVYVAPPNQNMRGRGLRHRPGALAVPDPAAQGQGRRHHPARPVRCAASSC